MKGSLLGTSLKNLSVMSELLPQLSYPLPAVNFTEYEIQLVLEPALPSIKHKLGLPRTMSNNDVFYPKTFGGYGTPDLHVEMMTQYVQYVVKQVRNDDSLGRRFRIESETY